MSAPVAWPDDVDAILTGDLTAGLAYVTPAGGTVLTAVAPIGLRDRARGTVGFTTSLGFGRKLERIAADPRVALAYHSRQHGLSSQAGLVVVQGAASVEPDSSELREQTAAQAEVHMGPLRRGRFWDAWLQAYYADRVVVTVTAQRILHWPDERGAGEPEVIGPPLPAAPEAPAPPAKGTAARLDVTKEVRRLRPAHRLLAWRGGDGYPVIVAADEITAGPDVIMVKSPASILPAGGRRAALLAHEYHAELIGLRTRYDLGWMEATPGWDGPSAPAVSPVRFAPHVAGGFFAPPNKTVLLLANGYLARRNLKRSRRKQGSSPAGS
jgi:hypothetical protein